MAEQPAVNNQVDDDDNEGSWGGMIAFASILLVLVGAFHALGGLIALLEPTQYMVTDDNLILPVSYTVFGLVHIAVGVAMIFASYGVFWGRTWARVIAVAVCAVSAITAVGSLSSNPIWYAVIIAIDLLIIYAVTVHGGAENREY